MMTRHTDLLLAGACLLPLASVASPARATNPDSYNLARPISALYDKLESGGRATMLVVGDSVSFREDSYLGFLQEHLWAEFGAGDDGYRGASNAFGAPQSFHPTRAAIGGSWRENAGDIPSRARISGPREIDVFFQPTDLGPQIPDGIYTQLEDGAEFFVNGYGPTARLFFYAQPGAGDAQIEVNGSTIESQLTTAAAEPTLLIEEVATGAAPGETYSLSVFAAPGTGPVVFAGAQMINTSPGLTIHRTCRGGSGPDDFLKTTGQPATDHLRALEPDLLWVMLDPDQRFEELYLADMNALLDYYAQVFPGVPTVLVSHHPFIIDIELQSDQLLQLARERDMGYIDLYDTWADLDAMTDAGLMNGVVHLSPAGGQWFGDYLYGVLTRARTCPADWDTSGVVDFFDVLGLLGAIEAGEPVADVDASGSIDFFDVLAFLALLDAGCD